MDPFTFIVAGGLIGLLIVLLLLGVFYPGSGADVLDWKPTRSPEQEAELEIQEVDDMLAARNARRRSKGLPELTEEDFERRVHEDQLELARMRERYRADFGGAPSGGPSAVDAAAAEEERQANEAARAARANRERRGF